MSVTRIPLPRRAPPYGTTPPASFDASGPAPHTVALKSSWFDGYAYGERVGYVAGWRWGLLSGGGAMLLLCGAAVAAAKSLGWL
jgi:hypothetical protein